MEQRRDPRRRALFYAALVAVILLIVYVPLRARIERPGRPREAPVAGSSVSIFFTDELAGYREPCGWRKREQCGMARWASLVEERRRERPVLVIDAGDFSVPPESPFREVRNRYFLSAMKLLRYDAVGIGGRETAAGLDDVLANARSYGIPLVNSNILTRGHKEPAATTSIIRELGGSKTLFGRKRAARIGIFSVALPGLIYRSGPDVPKRYYIVDPKVAALQAVASLRARGCNLVVAVSHLGWPASLELAREVRGIDVVLNGHRSHKATYEERVGSTVVVDTGDNERSFTEVSVTFAGDSLLVTSMDVCSVAVKNPGDPRFLELQEKYAAEIKRLTNGSSHRTAR